MVAAVKVLSRLWIVACVAVGLMNWTDSTYPPVGRLGTILLISLPGLAGRGLACQIQFAL
jgi:hypothetical protein